MRGNGKKHYRKALIFMDLGKLSKFLATISMGLSMFMMLLA